MASINTRENTLLNEKYRPVDLDNYVGNAHLKATLAKQLSQNDIQNYLFYGPAGTGKTTLAKLIISNLECDSLYINASDERGTPGRLRDHIQRGSIDLSQVKAVILDEADFLTIQAQASLRNVIETFSRTTRFILTCNFVERIIDPLQSRCQTFKIVPPTKKEVAIHVAGICDKENIGYELPDIGHLVSKYYPDIRKILNTLQSSVIEGKVELDDSLLVSSNYMSSVLEGLKNNDFKAIRQTIADSNVDDFDELFRFLYENSTEFMPNKEGTAAILINEHLYKANFRIDKEINLMSLIQNLINNK